MKKRMLIVDDEPSIRLILEHYFSLSYRVVAKGNGKEAIMWLEEGNEVDVIIADYDMPLMNGLDFIRQIRAHALYHRVPLVILSGRDESKDKIKCLKEGADDYMIKPFNPEELEVRLSAIFRRITSSTH